MNFTIIASIFFCFAHSLRINLQAVQIFDEKNRLNAGDLISKRI
jgi:hypothetical protein